MLFVRPKIAELALRLFGRSVHPELFECCAERRIEREHYRLTAQVTTAGHVLTFANREGIFTEVCAGVHHGLPKQQCLISQPIQTNHSVQCSLPACLEWHTSFHYESVDPCLFQAIEEQLAPIQQCEGLLHRFQASGRMAFGGLSYISIQSFCRYALVRVFHTFPDAGAVIKSRTRFSVVG